MTTQRDRLAEAFLDGMTATTADDTIDWGDVFGLTTTYKVADALLAHGVRVVDVETLAAAIANAFEYGPKLSKDAATELIATLDELP